MLSMTRSAGIIAYGSKEDREKVAELALLHGVSASTWIINQIRRAYELEIGEPLGTEDADADADGN